MINKNFAFVKLMQAKEYRLFWIAAFFSNMGMWALVYGRLWLMRTMTDSEIMLGLVASANLTPVLLLSIFGGLIADKYNRLKILRSTRFLFSIMTLLTGFLIFFKVMNPIILILISIITGILLAIDIPSRSSMIAKLVTKDQLATAISMYSIVFGVSAIVGPSLFHPIVNYFGLSGIFFIIGIFYLLTFVTLIKMNLSIHNPTKEIKSYKVFDELYIAAKYLVKTPILFIILSIGILEGITAGSIDVLIPAITTDILNGTSKTYGNLLLIGGISGLFSTSFLILYGDKINKYTFYVFSGLLYCLALIILGSNFGMDKIFYLFFIIAAARVIHQTMGTTIIQSRVKEEFRGRVLSILNLSWGAGAIGSVFIGFLAESFSINFAIFFAGIISFIALSVGGFAIIYKYK